MPTLRMRKQKWPKTAVNAFRLPQFPSLKGDRVAESNGVVIIIIAGNSEIAVCFFAHAQ